MDIALHFTSISFSAVVVAGATEAALHLIAVIAEKKLPSYQPQLFLNIFVQKKH